MKSPERGGAQNLQETVLAGGYCVGCGACASLESSPFKMEMNSFGQYEPQFRGQVFASTNHAVNAVCPFSEASTNEDEIAQDLFGREATSTDGLGYHINVYAGYVEEGDFRSRGSSGGFGSWILNELLTLGMVDKVLHVRANSSIPGKPLFAYSVSDSRDQIIDGRKSRYYPVELSQALDKVRREPGRYTIIGLPCFIKSIRLLQREDPVFRERIVYCIGLVCGHLKSSRYAESLAWQAGIPPDQLSGIDFRAKELSARADRYNTSVTGGGEERVVPTKDLFGTDWGAGTFKYKACDFCDDVFAETADLVLGDAWLPKYVNDSLGTNILVVRNPELKVLVDEAFQQKRIKIEPLDVRDALLSQDAGLRHRREGLRYRLAVEKEKGNWVPPKRVLPSAQGLPMFERQRQLMRIKLRDLSHTAFADARREGRLSVYLDALIPLYDEYKGIRPGLARRLRLKLLKLKDKLVGRA